MSKHNINLDFVAQTIVSEIEKDLLGRGGLRQEWDQIDTDIQAEILQEWISIIASNLKKWNSHE